LDAHNDLAQSLGHQKAEHALASLSELCSLCTRHGRRPLMRHGLKCKCVGADEACFAHFIGAATDGAREDAMLIATLLVRPDVAPVITALATEFGLALKQMDLAERRTAPRQHTIPTTLH